MVAEAFGLARPAGPLQPWAHSTFPTWTLDTADGRVLVTTPRATTCPPIATWSRGTC